MLTLAKPFSTMASLTILSSMDNVAKVSVIETSFSYFDGTSLENSISTLTLRPYKISLKIFYKFTNKQFS